MGNGNVKAMPPLASFITLSEEFEKLRSVGLTIEEIHLILGKRVSTLNFDTDYKLNELPIEFENFSAKEEQLRDARPIVDERKISAETIPVPQVVNAKNGVIVLIDDSAVATKVASKVLTELNFEIVCANSAKTGYDIILRRKDEIDLIFLDVVMPEVDGVECLTWIKENVDTAYIPVYMLSGLEDQMLSEACVDRGAEGMLLKPLCRGTVNQIVTDLNIIVVKPNPVIKKPNIMVAIPSSQIPNVDPFEDQLCIGATVPSFKLCGSDFKIFHYLAESRHHNSFLFVFLPTVYYSALYLSHGLMKDLCQNFTELQSRSISIICISNDLPAALASAKDHMKLPFRFLSDNVSKIGKKFVGYMDIGHMMTSECTNDTNSSLPHRQNSYFGPKLGLILINNKNKTIVQKWVGKTIKSQTACQIEDFPFKLMDWINNSPVVINPSPENQTIPCPTPRSITLEDMKRTGSSRTPRSPMKGKHHGSSSAAGHDLHRVSTKDSKETVSKDNILVVDDSGVASRVVSKKLESYGFQVKCAFNGQIAYEILRKSPDRYGLVLSDVIMPICDGINLLKLIMGNEELKAIPVVMLSGLDDDELAEKCIEQGAIQVMKKPFDELIFQEILTKLKMNPKNGVSV